MTKKNKTPFGIFIEAVGLYFSNFRQFVKYMTFPVLGQFAGLGLIVLFTYIYSKNLPLLIEKYAIFNNFNILIAFSILVSLPGMVIYIKAFWEYLVAYGAVNSMLDNMQKSGRVYDFSAHTELIKRRTISFVGLWLIIGIFSLVAMFPLFWIPAGVIAIYAILVFQVFTYESNLTPIGCIKRSFELIKGHFASTFLIIALSGMLTWFAIPQVINKILALCGLNELLSKIFIPVVGIFTLDELNIFLEKINIPTLQDSNIAIALTAAIAAQIIIQYTLPLRSILCGLWYKELAGNSIQKTSKKTSKKGPSEKLMEESHKKFAVKKIDRNILRRAMEKDNKDS